MEISISPDLWQQSYLYLVPGAAAPIHDAAVFWREEESPLALSNLGFLQSHCCYLYGGVLLHPKTRSSGLDPAAIAVTGTA